MKKPSPYLKMRVLGAIESAPGATRRDRFRAVAAQDFEENGHRYRFTWRTVETWYTRYKKHGVEAVQRHPRTDKGRPRKMTPEELAEAIEQVLPLWRSKGASPRLSHVYRELLERGLVERGRLAVNTFRRMVARFELLKPEAETTSKARLAFSKAHANQMWQADTMFGPYIKPAGGAPAVPTRLIAFIDDASRLLCHGEFFVAENTPAMIGALRSAMYKRGVPEQLYVDNGSIYSSKEIVLICARIGTILSHTPVRDGAAKGKIERFFRTVREEFLVRELDLSSLEALNRQFSAWVEGVYNSRTHSALGMSPLDRFGLELRRLRFLSPCEANEELFFMEEERTVKADNTFSFAGRRFEAPRHVAGRKILIRFSRGQKEQVFVYLKGERLGQAQPLDPILNDRMPKTMKAQIQGDTQ